MRRFDADTRYFLTEESRATIAHCGVEISQYSDDLYAITRDGGTQPERYGEYQALVHYSWNVHAKDQYGKWRDVP